MKVLYFAWLRERIGHGEEEIVLPVGVDTVADLIRHLVGKGGEYAHAFEKPEVIRAALDRVHVRHDAIIRQGREVAFFPPMTGG